MYVQGIKLANSGSNIQKNNTANIQQRRINLGTNTINRGADKVTFGVEPTGAIGPTAKLAGAVFNLAKHKNSIKDAKHSFSNGDIEAGLEIAINLTEKIGTKVSRKLIGFDDFIDTAADYANRLSDNTYANRDVKQRFIRTIFLRNIGLNHPSGDTILRDEIPESVKGLFRDLDPYKYRDFKKDLIRKAVFGKCIMIDHTDELLGAAAGKSFKKKISQKVKELGEEHERDIEEFHNDWRGKNPTG